MPRALPWALCPGMGLKECQDRPFLGSVPKKGHSSRSYAWRFNLQQLQQQPIKATFAEQQLLLQTVHWECSSHDWQQLQAAADQTLATTSVTVQAAEPRGSSRPLALQSLHCLTIGGYGEAMAEERRARTSVIQPSPNTPLRSVAFPKITVAAIGSSSSSYGNRVQWQQL